MNIKILHPAFIELKVGIDYYNNEIEGLGDRFKNEVYENIDMIKDFPLTGKKVIKI